MQIHKKTATIFLKESDHNFFCQTQSILTLSSVLVWSVSKFLMTASLPSLLCKTHFPSQTCTDSVQVNRLKTGAHTHTLSLSYIHTNASQITLQGFFSYHLCGKGWSPLSSPPTRAGPAPSGRWPVAWCRVRTRSYTCMASAWSQHASNRTGGRSHRCRRWWRSSPSLRWLWRTCDLWMEWQKFTFHWDRITLMVLKCGC